MKVPRSKVKTGYSGLLVRLGFVVESDLSFFLTHSIFVLGFVLVTGRWCATAHLRAHGPTPLPLIFPQHFHFKNIKYPNIVI